MCIMLCMCRFFGIPMNILPEIRSCSEVYGDIVSQLFMSLSMSWWSIQTLTLTMLCVQADGPLKGTPICGVSCSKVIVPFHGLLKDPLPPLRPSSLISLPSSLSSPPPSPYSPFLSSFLALFSLDPLPSLPSLPTSISVLVTSKLPW